MGGDRRSRVKTGAAAGVVSEDRGGDDADA